MMFLLSILLEILPVKQVFLHLNLVKLILASSFVVVPNFGVVILTFYSEVFTFMLEGVASFSPRMCTISRQDFVQFIPHDNKYWDIAMME